MLVPTTGFRKTVPLHGNVRSQVMCPCITPKFSANEMLQKPRSTITHMETGKEFLKGPLILISIELKVTATSLELEIRLHAHQVGI